MSVPEFKYHPDPIKTGAIVPSRNSCKCCGEKRGYVYKRNPYGRRDDLAESLCPWCIHSGQAHEKFNVLFADPWALEKAGIDQSIIAEVIERTPGYETWQGEIWLSHCNDACAFLGDASKNDLRNFEAENAQVPDDPAWDQSGIDNLLKYYEPKGSPAFYRFNCLHCGQILYAIDCD